MLFAPPIIQKAASQWTCGVFALCAVFSASVLTQAQDQVYPPKRPTPTQILPDILILGDQVVQEQWPSMLRLVNAPSDLKQVEPGQCIRFGVVASGDDRDQLLDSAKFTFEFTLAGKTQTFAAELAQTVKQIKPQGGDFVTKALGAAGIKNPVPSLASVADRCSPQPTHPFATMRSATNRPPHKRPRA